MWENRLVMGLMGKIGVDKLDAKDEIRLLRDTGFEGFFTGWAGYEYLKTCREAADETGMIYQSVHAPFGKARDFWHGTTDAAQAALDEAISCLEDSARTEVPIMIEHVFIGFEDHEPNQQGLDYFDMLLRRAKELGVKIAFENTEGMEYLDAVMEMSRTYGDASGFCWDTGHEMCYNWSMDMPGRYPGRMIATHINDNLGIRDYDGKITWIDDLHLLPFDGAEDWAGIAKRLSGFDGPLTFELTTQSKPNRHENDKYARMSAAEYLAEAYGRACRLVAMVNGVRQAEQ